MVTTTNTRTCILVAIGLLVTACSNGGAVSNASPRISTVPAQNTTGGATFSLDLSTYVSDREGATLSYAVTSGGGSFTGSTYSNTFDTIGTWQVQFTVSDGSKTETGSFDVEVTSTNLQVVVEDGASLLLLDTKTNKLKRFASSMPNPSFITKVGTRYVLYKRDTSGDLFVYDAFTGKNTQLAADVAGVATYEAVTSDGRVVYSTGTAPDRTLWYYNPVTGVARDIASNGLSTLTVLVNASDLVFFEAGVGGQADVFYYDAEADEVVAVGEAATDEQLQAVLPNGAVVFSRVGGGGETDLYYYRVGTGLVEIGADNSALATRSKTYQVHGSNSKVVFTATNGANDELYFWNPNGGATTAIATGIDTSVFATVGAGNEVVYYDEQSSTEWDARYYDLDDATSATLRNGSDKSLVSAVVNDGTTSWAIIRPSGTTTSQVAVSLVSSPSTQTYNAGGTVDTGLLLDNGDYVARRDDGTALCVFDVSAGSWGTPITGTALVAQGDGIAAGDFVYRAQVASQNDLLMWDASAAASVTVSNTTGNDDYQALTLDATVLFTRVVSGNTTADLFVWDGSSETRLTDKDADNVYHDYATSGAAFAVSKQ